MTKAEGKKGSEKKKKKTTELPWSVRGISHETRNFITKAAKKQKKKKGEWMNEVLLKAAQEVITSKAKLPTLPHEDVLKELNAFKKEQTELNSKIDAIIEHQSKPLIKRIFGG